MSLHMPKQYIFDLHHLFKGAIIQAHILAKTLDTDLFSPKDSLLIGQHFCKHSVALNCLIAGGYDVVVNVLKYYHEAGDEIKFSITASEMFGKTQDFDIMRRRGEIGYTGCYEHVPEGPVDEPTPLPQGTTLGALLANQLSAYTLTQLHPFNNDQRFSGLPDGLELIAAVQAELMLNAPPARLRAKHETTTTAPLSFHRAQSFWLVKDMAQTLYNVQHCIAELSFDGSVISRELLTRQVHLALSNKEVVKDLEHVVESYGGDLGRVAMYLNIGHLKMFPEKLAKCVANFRYRGWVITQHMDGNQPGLVITADAFGTYMLTGGAECSNIKEVSTDPHKSSSAGRMYMGSSMITKSVVTHEDNTPPKGR